MGFEDWTVEELFDYLIDNLIIPPGSSFKHWKNYKSDMLMLSKDFYDNNEEDYDRTT